ncbi:MAG: hypothetical protein VX701_00775 [Chloroflexota bacterium]|nr:hypothetical protein [Chloroflexota bacterium]
MTLYCCINIRITPGAAITARSRSEVLSRLPNGCGTTTNGNSGIPPSDDIALALDTNGSVHITAVGMPSFSRVMPSCTLHDEQEPQSPEAVITTSHSILILFRMSSGHGLEAFLLSIENDFIPGATSFSTSNTNVKRLSELGLLLDKSPTTLPSSDSGLCARKPF